MSCASPPPKIRLLVSDLAGAPRRVHADLHLVIGGLSTDIVADGGRITLRTDHPARLFTAATSAALPYGVTRPTRLEAVGRVGRVLTEAGLSATVEGGRGVVIELGDGCRSRFGRLLLGTESARLGSVRAVVPASVGYLLSAARRRTSSAVAGLALAALLGGGATARRQRVNRPDRHLRFDHRDSGINVSPDRFTSSGHRPSPASLIGWATASQIE